MTNIIGNLLFSLPVGNQLGEGVQWHIDTQSIWWTDIEGTCLYSYSVAEQAIQQHTMPERVGCFCFIESDPRLLIAFESGFAFYDVESSDINWLAKPELDKQGNRFNDGRVDRFGNFWAGTMIEAPNDESKPASLYKLSSNNGTITCQNLLSDITVSNGLCFSLDGQKLYHADSPTQNIMQFDVNTETGALSNKTHFATTKKNSYPDGATIDSEGYLWNAQWGGSRVVRYKPNGEVDIEFTVPVSQPSCVAIGGPAMDWLIITSAKQDLSSQQLNTDKHAGDVFVYQLNGIKGVEENQFIL